MASIRQQLHNNAVALISLVIAVSSLGYNTWRNETTEEQRNLRHASFRVFEVLGEIQEVVDYRYYYLPFEDSGDSEGETRLHGWGSVKLIRDLMNLMPAPAPLVGQELHRLWTERFGDLDDLDADGRHSSDATEAERELTNAINGARDAVAQVLKGLE